MTSHDWRDRLQSDDIEDRECFSYVLRERLAEDIGEIAAAMSAPLRGILNRVVGANDLDWLDVDDLIQLVFIKMLRNAEAYDKHRGRPLTWIYTIAQRIALDRKEKEENYRARVGRLPLAIQQRIEATSPTTTQEASVTGSQPPDRSADVTSLASHHDDPMDQVRQWIAQIDTTSLRRFLGEELRDGEQAIVYIESVDGDQRTSQEKAELVNEFTGLSLTDNQYRGRKSRVLANVLQFLESTDE